MKHKIKLVLLLTVLLLIIPAAVLANTATVNYLALGDSLAAGQTPWGEEDKGYPDFLAVMIESNGYTVLFNNYGVSGYTTESVLQDIYTDKDGIKNSIARADIITLDIGANDILHNITFDKTTGSLTFDEQTIVNSIKTMGKNAFSILSAVKTLNPEAKIYLMGYYNPYPHLPDAAMQIVIESLMDNINLTLQGVAQSVNAVFIPTSDVIAQNAAVYLPNSQNIHPSLEGYQVLAHEFWRVMESNYPEPETGKFSDIAGHWGQQDISKFVSLGAVTGYPDETFRPNSKITRAEFITVLVKAFNPVSQNGKVFSDTVNHWAKDYIVTAAANGIVNGYNANSFGPDDLISREQMAVMITKAVKLTIPNEEPAFTDNASISPWAKGAVAAASKNGIMSGYPDQSIKPQAYATRAEAVAVIAGALKLATNQ